MHWDEGVLTITEPDRHLYEVVLGPDGVVIMPSVFCWPEVSVRKQTSTQTTLHYPARGAATVRVGVNDRSDVHAARDSRPASTAAPAAGRRVRLSVVTIVSTARMRHLGSGRRPGIAAFRGLSTVHRQIPQRRCKGRLQPVPP